MKRFHHIGLVAREPQPGEMYFESLRCWGTDPSADFNHVEWVRFQPDSPLADTPVAKMPHVSWQVDDLDRELQGKDVAVGPIEAAPGVRIAYFFSDGALVEYLELQTSVGS